MPNNTTISQTPSEPSQHDNCEDFCSPFCYCACCGSSFQIALILHLKIVKIAVKYPEKVRFMYKNGLTSSYLNSLFRPPQLG